MSVASHLAVRPAKYDARIRTLIPLYDELIAEVAHALGHTARPVRTVVDLGIGTGASVSGLRPMLASVAPMTARSREVTRIEHCLK